MTPQIKLTYFDIEGVAEAVRLAFLLSKTPYEDDRVAFSDWPALKPQTPFGQLPMLTITGGNDDAAAGGVVVRTQSKAMLRWVGHTFSKTLYPMEKLFDVEEAMGVVEDLNRAFTPSLYTAMSPEIYGHPVGFAQTEEGKAWIKAMRETFVTELLPKCLNRIEGMIKAHDGPWMVAGSEPTIADCVAVPLLRSYTKGHIDHVPVTCLDAHPEIVRYIKDFCALDGIKGRYSDGIH